MEQSSGTALALGFRVATRIDEHGMVLSVSIDAPPHDWSLPGEVVIRQVRTGREALHSLRASWIDLMIVPLSGPDFQMSGLMGRVRMLRPKQAWVVVHDSLTDKQEICARTLGAIQLLQTPPNRALVEMLVASLGMARRRRCPMSSQGPPDGLQSERIVIV